MSVQARPRLSIVVLNFRTPEMTVRAIQHALDASADLDPEMIVVDNGSGDGSTDMIAARCPGAKVVALMRNMGFAAGMNAGIRESAGGLVLLLNSDTKAMPGSIPALVEYLAGHSEVGLAAPVTVSPDGRRRRSLLIEPTAARALIPGFGKLAYRRWHRGINGVPREVEATEGCAMMVTRDALDRAGLLDERFFFYHEIVDWCMRIRRAGLKVVLAPQACVMHECGGSTVKRYRAARVELKRSEYQIIEKHLGGALRNAAVLRDGVLSTVKSAGYGVCILASLGMWRRVREKFAAHYGVLRWLLAGMPARTDPRYVRMLGGWD